MGALLGKKGRKHTCKRSCQSTFRDPPGEPPPVIYLLVVSDTPWQTAPAPGPPRESLWRKHRALRVSRSCAPSPSSGPYWAPIAIREVLAKGKQGAWALAGRCPLAQTPAPKAECSRLTQACPHVALPGAPQRGQSSWPCGSRSRAGSSVRGRWGSLPGSRRSPRQRP